MTKFLLFIAIISLLGSISGWIFDRPGKVIIEWQGWILETSVPILISSISIIVIVSILVIFFISWVYRRPSKILKHIQNKRKIRGIKALTEGLAAIAVGDIKKATIANKTVRKNLDQPPLSALLEAQVSIISDDTVSAQKTFKKMLKYRETELLGLKGLISISKKNGNFESALKYIQSASNLNQNTPWINTQKLELATFLKNWNIAKDTVENMRELKKTAKNRLIALINIEIARLENNNSNLYEALNIAEQANRMLKGFSPAACLIASIKFKLKNERGLKKLLEQTWKKDPHPSVAENMRQLSFNKDPLKRMNAIKDLVKENSNLHESRLEIAQEAISCKIWGVAKKHLDQLVSNSPSVRTHRLMAKLFQEQYGDKESANKWLNKALNAPSDPEWICEACFKIHVDWTVACMSCNSLDSIIWNSPDLINAKNINNFAIKPSIAGSNL